MFELNVEGDSGRMFNGEEWDDLPSGREDAIELASGSIPFKCMQELSISTLLFRTTYSLQLAHALEQVHHDGRVCRTGAGPAAKVILRPTESGIGLRIEIFSSMASVRAWCVLSWIWEI